MNRSAVLHIPMSQYAYGIDEKHVMIRLRAGRGDLKTCRLYYGDRACRLTPVLFTAKEMQVEARTEEFDYWQGELTDPYRRLCYYFLLDDGTEQSLYYGDRFTKETVDDRSEYYQLPFNHRADIVAPPQWVQDTVIYNIFPDSFATGHRFISGMETERDYGQEKVHGKLGGTIKGITENIDYLTELGVNAIYINPIFAAGEYHKYDLVDYYHIDPCFGTDEEFGELVQHCHEKGIRVIIDGVFNHCGWHFMAFNDVVEKGEASDYKDWFYRLEYPVVRPEDPETYPGYECFGYERMMPKLALDQEEAADYFCQVGQYWIERYNIDGWRLDVASEINDGFWRKFRAAVKKCKKDAVLIGEVWESAGHWLDGTMFDSTMNYDFRKHCKRFFAEETADALEFDSRVTDMRMRYRKQTVFSQLNLLDSHDVSRFLSICKNVRSFRLAVIFQMTFPGMPSVFYGDEAGVTGILEAEYRSPMPWDTLAETDELFYLYQRAIGLRKRELILKRGEYRTITAEEGSRLYGYERYLGSERIRIFLNMEEHAAELLPEWLEGEILWQEGLTENRLQGRGFVIIKGRD